MLHHRGKEVCREKLPGGEGKRERERKREVILNLPSSSDVTSFSSRVCLLCVYMRERENFP